MRIAERYRGAAQRGAADDRMIADRDARQGEIILTTPLRKMIFILGLAGGVILAAIAAFL